jgi:hypothetical protein
MPTTISPAARRALIDQAMKRWAIGPDRSPVAMAGARRLAPHNLAQGLHA